MTDDAVHWQFEAAVAIVIAAYSVVLGGLVGLIWPAVAPQIDGFRATFLGSESAYKALLGDDVWLAFLSVLAGIVCVALLFVVARGGARSAARGPGAVVGLAGGGGLGALIAGQVGHHAHNHVVLAALQHAVVAHHYKRLTSHGLAALGPYVNFTPRADAVLLAWPIAAVIVYLLVVWRRGSPG